MVQRIKIQSATKINKIIANLVCNSESIIKGKDTNTLEVFFMHCSLLVNLEHLIVAVSGEGKDIIKLEMLLVEWTRR